MDHVVCVVLPIVDQECGSVVNNESFTQFLALGGGFEWMDLAG